MGEVYLGHDTILDRAVAIKLIGGVHSPDVGSRERFLIEARAIARLSHPNVVTIFRVGATTDGRPFLVQELIRGRSLDRVPRPMPWREVGEIAVGIARGLDAAHRRGILHRDIKPANVMLDDNGTARLLDFGLAKLGDAAVPVAPPPRVDIADTANAPTAPPRADVADAVLAVAATREAPGVDVADAVLAVAATREAPGVDVAATRDVTPPALTAVTAMTAMPAVRAKPATTAMPAMTSVPAMPATTAMPAMPEMLVAVRASPPAPTAMPATTAMPAMPAMPAVTAMPTAGISGIAAVRVSPPPTVIHTAPGSVIGTPRYTAPENWRGEPSTERSDLYSLGALLYELLTGVAPHPETELGELAAAVLAGTIRPVLELAPETHVALAELVTRCLATDPASRPATAAELAHALESLLVDAPSVPEGNPYRGLRAFDAAHRGLFFGRGADVGALVDRFRTENLVVVVGDSGIGKSSVCHAGVVPAVTSNALGDGRSWRAVTLAPGRTPWSALCEALAIPTSSDARALRQPTDAGVLLVFDQLEELVTLADPDEAARTSELLAAIAAGIPGVKTLLAVRGDFLTRVAALPALANPMTRGLHLLRALSRDDLHEAIVGPARAKGVHFETTAMVDELATGVVHNPGALPLLQFTLAELWQSRVHDTIPAAALTSLGGVDGALAGHADRVLLSLPPPERAAARNIVMRLVTDARTRAVRPRDELTAGEDPVAVAALESLVRGRLVVARDTVGGAPSYELAHEALIKSWHTLRNWLDEAAGEHAARNRLAASAGEWQRLERKPDLLWSRRQLDELPAVDDLSPTERAFVDASRTQLRRRRIARIAAIAAVPLVAIAIYTAVRFEAARRRDREVAARIAAAGEQRMFGDRFASEAARLRARAFEHYEAARTNEGELTWGVALALSRAADAAYLSSTAELEGAFMIEPTAVRAPMAETLWAHAELAEAMYDTAQVRHLLARMAAFDKDRRAQWDVPGYLSIRVDEPAMLSLHASSPTGSLAGRFDATPIATGTAIERSLHAGSYLIVARPKSGEPIRFPVFLSRGERLAQSIEMPRAAVAGYVYVPAGRFLTGTDRDERVRREFLRATPLHHSYTASYWIAPKEVSFGEWIEFLRDVPVDKRVDLMPNSPGNQRTVQMHERNGRFVLEFDPSETPLQAAEGDPLIYTNRGNAAVRWERLPVVGVPAKAAEVFAAWLRSTGRLPGARLCTVAEWEHAARGADGRTYPHGESLEPYQANHDVTYRKVGYGLDEVGSFPASDSPFGVQDLAGNAAEMAIHLGDVVIKGGSYYQSALTAMASNTSPATRATAVSYLGIRLCADPAR